MDTFLYENKLPLTLLWNSEWLWKLVFVVDLTKHVYEFNTRLQGENWLIFDTYAQVKSFKQKLVLL
jgi:hypothetical protein